MLLTLRPATPDDAAAAFAWRADAVAKGWVPGRPVEELRRRFSEAEPRLYHGAPLHLWIAEVDGQAAGQLILKREELKPAEAELGYVFAPEVRGKGVAEKAVRAFMERVVAETPVRSLLARTNPDNIPSQKLLVRLGFKPRGGKADTLYYRWSAPR